MKKALATQVILCGVLSCSMAVFGMNNQQPNTSHVAVTQSKTDAHKDQATHSHHLADIVKKIEADVEGLEKKIVTDFEKLENIIHPLVQQGAADLKQHPEVIAAVLNTVGVKQQEAQNITNAIEKGVDITTKVDDSVHNLTQKLEQVQVSKANQNVTEAVKK